jgi:hypothetical protein
MDNMKRNILLFLGTFILSFGLALLGFRCRDQHRVENIRLKLENDINQLLETRQNADISTLLQSNPVRKHTSVEKQLDDGSKVAESDLEAYLHQVLISSSVSRIQIHSVFYDARDTIQTVRLSRK